MSPFKMVLPALAGFMLAGSALAADTTAAPPPRAGMAHAGMTRPGCHGIFRDLTPEQRIIHFQDVKKKMDTLTVTQFQDWRKDECDKFDTLTPDARKKYADGLDAKWKALSDSEKLKLYHDALSMRGRMGQGMGQGMGHGPRHFRDGRQDGQGYAPNHHNSHPRD